MTTSRIGMYTASGLLKRAHAEMHSDDMKLLDRFRSLLNSTEPVEKLLSSAESEALIALHGRSGAGKTTLAMKFLGIDEESEGVFREIADCLRGNTRQTNAGTAVPTRYSITKEEQYILRDCGKVRNNLDNKELKDALMEIRRSVEQSRRDPPESVAVVEIPERFVSVGHVDGIHRSILDLPGVGSNVKSEHSHVNKVLSHYVHSVATGRVVVVSAEEMVALTHEDEFYGSREEGTHWTFLLESTCLVFTHFFSLESVRNRIEENAEQYKINPSQAYADLRNIEHEKICTMFKENPWFDSNALALDHVFLLEYGTSWEELCKDNKEYFDIVRPIRDIAFDKLRSKLSDMATRTGIVPRLREGVCGWSRHLDSSIVMVREAQKLLCDCRRDTYVKVKLQRKKQSDVEKKIIYVEDLLTDVDEFESRLKIKWPSFDDIDAMEEYRSSLVVSATELIKIAFESAWEQAKYREELELYDRLRAIVEFPYHPRESFESFVKKRMPKLIRWIPTGALKIWPSKWRGLYSTWRDTETKNLLSNRHSAIRREIKKECQKIEGERNKMKILRASVRAAYTRSERTRRDSLEEFLRERRSHNEKLQRLDHDRAVINDSESIINEHLREVLKRHELRRVLEQGRGKDYPLYEWLISMYKLYHMRRWMI